MLKGGKLLTVSHGTIDNGVLVMPDGKIAAIGAAGSVNIPSDAQVIDVTGMTVYPGLIDSETYLGLTEISAEQMTNDLDRDRATRSCRRCTCTTLFMPNRN